jgi:hypothetical protein
VNESEGQLVRVVNELKSSIDKLRDELVRKDVYTAQREADQKDVAEVTKDVAEIKESMRWRDRVLVASLLLPLVTSFILLYVSQQVSR